MNQSLTQMQTLNDAKLRRDGYIELSMLCPRSIEVLRSHFIDKLIDHEGIFQSTMQHNDPAYRKQVDLKIKELLQPEIDILMPDYRILFANFLMKHPGQGSEVGVHMDWSYVDESRHTSYNLWIPLVDVDESNGCIHIWPTSHHFTPQKRATPFVPLSENDQQRVFLHSIPVLLTAGQGMLYHSGLLHYSNANYSAEARPALALVIVPKGAQPVHYFEKSKGLVNEYAVDTDFYYRHRLYEEPTGYELTAVHDMPKFDLNDALYRSKIEETSNVGKYYDEWTDQYQDVYGDVIQAYRPKNEEALLDYIASGAGLANGQTIVDAGCGTCGPAVYFAKKFNLKINAITVSNIQVEKSNIRINENHLTDRVFCWQSDFRFMKGVSPASANGVLFLESLGHSEDPELAIEAAYEALVFGGFVYIKDFFEREAANAAVMERIAKTTSNINIAYEYNVLKLQKLLSALRKTGFVIDFVRTLKFESDTNIRREFEDRFDISVFEGGEFIPAEWLEVRAIKFFSEDDR